MRAAPKKYIEHDVDRRNFHSMTSIGSALFEQRQFSSSILSRKATTSHDPYGAFMAETEEPTPKGGKLAPRCVSIDLEVGKTNQRIHRIGAVRGDTHQEFSAEAKQLHKTLAKLDEFADGAAFVLGHNVIDFDLPHLRAAKPACACCPCRQSTRCG